MSDEINEAKPADDGGEATEYVDTGGSAGTDPGPVPDEPEPAYDPDTGAVIEPDDVDEPEPPKRFGTERDE